MSFMRAKHFAALPAGPAAGLVSFLLVAAASLPALAQQAPILPRPVAPRTQTPAVRQGLPALPGAKPLPPQLKPGEIDWRGLEEGKKGHLAPSPVTALIKNAPYRVEIATTDGSKVMITNGYTLERRRVLEAPVIAGMAFSGDGVWLYVVTGTGEVLAVDVETAKVSPLAKIVCKPGESVADVRGAGSAELLDVTVLLGQQQGAEAASPQGVTPGSQCGPWTAQRRVRLHRDVMARAPAMPAWQTGWPEQAPSSHLAATSPNTKYRISLQNGALMASGRFGGGDTRISRSPVPGAVADLDWMRDSEGIVASWPRRAVGACRQLQNLRAWRRPKDIKDKQPGWQEWTLPEGTEVVRGDLPRALTWAPDGMRLVGVDARGVVLIEPAPRFRGPLALVAPPSTLWPLLRPGVRALPGGAGGALRHTELLMEQGDLDAAARQLAVEGRAGGAEVQKLQTRLSKLVDARARRAAELHIDLNDVRSVKTAAPKLPVLQEPAPLPPEDDVTDPAAAATPTR